MIIALLAAALLASTPSTIAQPRLVTLDTADGGRIQAFLYAGGDRGVVLGHGAVFNKESWGPQAERLAAAGYTVLAIDFRGYGESVGGADGRALYQDVLGGVRFLKSRGLTSVSVIGGSMGGGAAAAAATRAEAGEIDKLILLSGVPIGGIERIKSAATLFVVSEGEGMAPQVEDQYERAPQPKRLELLPGAAHAQHIFKTDQAEPLMRLILEFLESGGR